MGPQTMALAAGRKTQHTANSRTLRTFASAVVSSVSSQLSSTSSVAGPEHHHHRHQTKNLFSLPGEASSPIVTISLSEDDNPQHCTERAQEYYSDVASGSGRGHSLSPRPLWVSASILHDGRNFTPRSRQFRKPSLSSGQGSRQRMQSSTGCSLQGPESEIYHHGMNSPPRSRQFHGQSLSSSPGSRQCMESWTGFSLKKPEFEVYEGRLHGKELSRVQIWHSSKRFHMGHAHHHNGGGYDKTGKANERILGWGLWSDIGLAIGKGGAGHSHEHVHGGGHHHGIDLQHPYVALTAAVVSIGVKETLYQRTKKIGEEQHSELLKASAWHHRSDAVSSIVALLGIGGAILGMPLLDPVAGFVVSGMIIKAGCETGYQSLQDLVDSGVQESILSPIRNSVLHVEGVEGCHHLRGRRMGSFIHIDAHIEVDPWLSVSSAHNIAEAVRHHVHSEHPEVSETFVHIEPADGGIKPLTHAEAEHEHELHDHNGESHKHPDISEESFNRKDLTDRGSKSDLLKSSHTECVDDSFSNDVRQHPRIDQDVRGIVGANFQEKMTINHVTSHFVQGKVVVEVEVSMNPEISVRIAMDYASEAERAILQKVSDISAVRVQLKLTHRSSQSK